MSVLLLRFIHWVPRYCLVTVSSMDVKMNCSSPAPDANESSPVSVRSSDFEDSSDLHAEDTAEDTTTASAVPNTNVQDCRLEPDSGEHKVDGDKPPERIDLNVDGKEREMESWIPQIGMDFKSEGEAYDFYNRYGGILGFSVRKHRTRKAPRGKEVYYRAFCCSKQGLKRTGKQHDDVRFPRRETRTGCQAFMAVKKYKSGIWLVVQLVKEHNHEFTKLLQTHMLRSQKKLNENRDTENDVGQSGIRHSFGVIPGDRVNFVHSAFRKALENGDAAAILEYLRMKRAEDPSFTSEMQYDEDCKITNIFWADARSITDYYYFGDVVCFDTTCKINKKGRPFGVFTGINHHKETVIFGAVLLYDETVPSYEWLFMTFTKAMGGKIPKTIITDKDKVMASAIASVLPNTYHRICVWHIYQNALQHLGHVFARVINGKKPFGHDFGKCVYNYEEEEEFLTAWQTMLDKYDLRQNSWLNEIFEERMKWAVAYGRHSFYGDMKSAQQHEKLNRSLKGSLESEQSLMQFFEHLEKVLSDQRYNELRADFKANQSHPKLSVPSPVLEQASKVYTPAAFRAFQEEYVHIYNYRVVESSDGESIKSLKVRAIHEKRQDHIVKFDPSTKLVECSCKKLEFEGFLCRHVFTVFYHEGILELPSRYIMQRWMKDAKVGSVLDLHGCAAQLDPDVEKARRKNELFAAFRKVSVEAVEYEESYKVALAYIDRMLQDVRRCKYRLDSQMLEGSTSQDNLDSADKATSPLAEGIKRKKHRITSGPEKGVKKNGPRNQLSHKEKDIPCDGNYSFITSEAHPSCSMVTQQVASLEANSSMQDFQLIHGIYPTSNQRSNASTCQYSTSPQLQLEHQIPSLYRESVCGSSQFR